jgi:uncharacterized membrane protein
MKLNLKSKIRNFFKISKEDLKKEECTKVFENKTWFTLSKNKIFYSILAFLFLINILVSFNLKLFYTRATLSFLFIIIIPGILIMLMMKIREVNFWEYLVYVIGLSIAFVMFAGLAVNWILPWLNITDKPLSTWPILICFNIFLISFWIIAKKRNQDLKTFKIQLPKLDKLNIAMFIIPISFPVLAILGAFLLNNHGTNILTMIMLGSIATYIFTIALLKKRLNSNVYPWSLLFIGLALLLMFSMRSWLIAGSDVVGELSVLNNSVLNQHWGIDSMRTTYNYCLSLTIFPSILKIFLAVKINILFKLFLQIITSILFLIIYLLSKKILNTNLSFFSGIFFMSQTSFIIELPSHIRQEIAFIFWGMILLVLFNQKIEYNLKKILFLIFGSSIIVSHYSTSYISLIILLLTSIFIIFHETYKSRKTQTVKKFSQKEKQFLNLTIILLLLIFGFIWYSQLTNTSEGLIEFSKKSFNNLGNMFNKDVQESGQSILDKINPLSKPPNIERLLRNSIKYYGNSTDFPDQKHVTNILPGKAIPTKFKLSTSFLRISSNILARLNILLVFFGGILFILNAKKSNSLKLFKFLVLSSLLFLGIFIFLPFSSIFYSISRMIQQFFIILSPFSIWFLFGIMRNRIKNWINYLYLIIIFLLVLGFIPQITGGFTPSLNLNNQGFSYDARYISSPEVTSTNWLSRSINETKEVISGRQYKHQFSLFDNTLTTKNIPFPNVITKKDYVYAGTSEIINKKSYIFETGILIPFNFPIAFLHENKNKIYDNGGSEIFK